LTPRLKPCVGAEAGPVIAARQPILTGSDSAMAGAGKEENDAAPNAPALPNKTPRREITIENSRLFPSSAPVVGVRGRRCSYFRLGAALFWRAGVEPDAPRLSRASRAWQAGR